MNITCSSDLDVQYIRWLNLSNGGEELYRNDAQQSLTFPIQSVGQELNNTRYICEVRVELATKFTNISQNITFKIDGKCLKFTTAIILSTVKL